MELCLPYLHTHHKKTYIWDRSSNLYQVLHVLQFQISSFSRCVRKKHVGILYLSVTFGRIQDSIIGSIVFLEPWCVINYLAVEVAKSLQNAPKIPMMLEQNLEKRIEPTNETSHVKFCDSHSIWGRGKQQAKQASHDASYAARITLTARSLHLSTHSTQYSQYSQY